MNIEVDESLACGEFYFRPYEPEFCPSCNSPRGCVHDYGCKIMNSRLPGQSITSFARRVGRAADFIETGSE